jgi:hypothetical protein
MSSSTLVLEPGEQVLLRSRLHPVALAGGVGAGAFVALVATLLIRHNALSAATNLRIEIWGGAIAVLLLIRPVLRWWRSAVVVTDRRLLVQTGALRLETLECPLAAENVAAGMTSALGRALDYGTLAVARSDGEGRMIWPLTKPLAIVESVQRAAKRSRRRG